MPANKGKEMPLKIRNKVSKNATGRKISDAQREEIIALYTTGKYTQKTLGWIYGVGADVISRIINNKTGWVARGRKNPKETKMHNVGNSGKGRVVS